MENDMLLSVENVTKAFSGTVVLQDVSFSLRKGEILGLVGENGAGKTTLMSILFGMPVIAATGGYGGAVKIDGKTVQFTDPFDALAAGIGMVHQEFSLIPGFTATENIMLNREITRSSVFADLFGKRLETLERKQMNERAEKVITHLGVNIDANTIIADMPVGHKQFVEIAREVDRDNVKLLVLDEPTAVLTESEAAILLNSVKRLAESGIAIIFISHRLQEIMDICDRVVILRDGLSVKDSPIEQTSIREIVSGMVGRDLDKSQAHDHKDLTNAPVIFKTEHLWVDMPGERVVDVSLEIQEGEIFGIAGLAGQGKIGIPNGIMGLFPSGGTVLFKDKPVLLNDPNSVLKQGIAFVSEDRRGVGLLLDESLEWNIAFNAMQTQGKYLHTYLGGLISLRNEREMTELAEEYIRLLEIKCTGGKQKAKELSGGNQQKVCLAKAFSLEPELLFVCEPTRGIDVGAKSLVLDQLRKYNSERGTTVVVISSELEELRSVCDRIAVVFQGRVAGILSPDDDITKFGLLMAGVQE